MLNSVAGYQAASGKNIPTGARCESVQLIPVDGIGKSSGSSAGNVANHFQPENEVHLLFRPPVSRGMDLPFILPISGIRYAINGFI